MNTKKNTKNEVKVGTQFIDNNFCVHTIEAIDEERVIHSYSYTHKGKKIHVHDGFMYRSVFDKFINTGVISIL